jgi:hypothetical protein
MRPYARMVALATGTPSPRQASSPQTKNATVMLGAVYKPIDG